jgi:ankyrin repeat protein
LFVALVNKHVDVAAMLIAAGADVNAVSTWVLPRAPPHFSKAFDESVLMQSHLCNRAEGFTATTIFTALMSGDIEIVRLLISAGADVNAVATWVLPRELPHFSKAFDGCVLLRSHLCNRDAEGATMTPMFPAFMIGDVEIVRLLIAAGIDVNAVSTWVLPRELPHFAKAFDGCVLMQSHLCNRVGGATATPICVALGSGNIEIVRLLISAGADVNAVVTWVLPRALPHFAKAFDGCVLDAVSSLHQS